LETGKKAQDQAQQISGRGEDGRAMTDSFKTAPENKNGRLEALDVTAVTPGGAAEQYYGLKKGDRIIEITTQAGLEKMNGASILSDPEMAKISVQSAFQASWPIVVMRNGRQITLPATPAELAAATARPVNTSGAAPAPSVAATEPSGAPPASAGAKPPPEDTSNEGQLKRINGALRLPGGL
jgi:hypothetical protein